MSGSLEVFENLAPLAVFASVALVDDDEVEEVGGELFVGVFVRVLVVGEALVEREIYIIGGVDLLVLNDGHCVLEVAEVAADGLVDERGAIGEEEDAFLDAAFPEAIDDLEGSVGFTGPVAMTRMWRFSPSFLATASTSSVNRDLLVVTGRASCAVGEIVL